MSTENKLAEHLASLERSLRIDDPRSVLPSVPEDCRRALDVGCGAGQVLIATDFGPEVELVGVDSDIAAPALGATLEPRIKFSAATGERLPFQNDSFDLLICRAALPYMHIPTAFREGARVLRPGGTLWMTLFTARDVWEDLGRALSAASVRNSLFQAYRLFNGSALHVFGRQWRIPAGSRRCESFQTGSGVKRELQKAGFRGVRVDRTKLFIVEATR